MADERVYEPAFPQDGYDSGESGMSLRDYFAAKALVLFSSPTTLKALHDEQTSRGEQPEDGIAKTAYAVADAMIRESHK